MAQKTDLPSPQRTVILEQRFSGSSISSNENINYFLHFINSKCVAASPTVLIWRPLGSGPSIALRMTSFQTRAISLLVLRHRQRVRYSPFTCAQASCLHAANCFFTVKNIFKVQSKITPNCFLCRTFGQFSAQLLTEASFKGKVIVLWRLLSCVHRLCTRDSEICELTFYILKLKKNPECCSWELIWYFAGVYHFSVSGVNFHLPPICLLTQSAGVHLGSFTWFAWGFPLKSNQPSQHHQKPSQWPSATLPQILRCLQNSQVLKLSHSCLQQSFCWNWQYYHYLLTFYLHVCVCACVGMYSNAHCGWP